MSVAAQIADMKEAGGIGPAQHPYFRITLDDFCYTGEGFANKQARWGSFEKEVWWCADLGEGVTLLREAQTRAMEMLPTTLREHPRAWLGVKRTFENLTLRTLEDGPPSISDVRARIAFLHRALQDEPVLVTIRADLRGVAILTPPFELQISGAHIRLRALTREDIEEEVPIEFRPIVELRLRTGVSAVMEIEYDAPDASGWQRELDRAVAILRLFGTGEIGYSTVRIGSESLVETGSGIILFDRDSPRPRTYALREGDPERLRIFWEVMSHVIPEHLYWNRSEDPRGLAATHLWFEKILAAGGWVNPQVAEVVRALESLLMRNGEKSAISEMLRERCSTLLGACGLDTREIKTALALAYEVRSRYVHGAELSARQEKKIQKEAGDTATVFRRCLNYLRLALVAAVAGGVENEPLITAIEAARKGDSGALQQIADAFRSALPPNPQA